MIDNARVGKRLRVRAYESLDEIEGLLPTWDRLLSKFPSATIFSTWEWLTCWWRAHSNGQRLMILGFFDTHENLAALAPLSLSTQGASRTLGIGVLRLMGDGSGDSDNLDLPVLPGYEGEFVQGLLEYLEAQAHCWDVCQLNTMPEQSPAGNELLKQLRQGRWLYHTYRHPCVAIPLPDTWGSYLRGLSSKERGKLSYYLRRLEKHHKVRFYRCSQEQEVAGCLEALFWLHQKRWQLRGEPGSFRSEARRHFYERITRLFLTKNWLEFWLLDIDGKPAAAQFGFRYRDTVFQLQEGYDPAYSSDSVGYVLRGYVLKQLITAGVRRYDFLGGDGTDKTRWGGEVGAYIAIHFSKPSYRGRFLLSLIHGNRQNREWLRKRLPTVWQALRKGRLRLRGA